MMSQTLGRVIVDASGRRRRLRLDRPAALNALTPGMVATLLREFEAAEACTDPCGGVVIEGSERRAEAPTWRSEGHNEEDQPTH